PLISVNYIHSASFHSLCFWHYLIFTCIFFDLNFDGQLSHTSLSALVVWRPTDRSTSLLRILFVSPNAHQARVLASLEAVATANCFLRHAKPTSAQISGTEYVTTTASAGPADKRPTRLSTIPTSGRSYRFLLSPLLVYLCGRVFLLDCI
ncbi:unnamed protein product, partial [Protopolystoma xenopodis]